jgi:hypothetical protein
MKAIAIAAVIIGGYFHGQTPESEGGIVSVPVGARVQAKLVFPEALAQAEEKRPRYRKVSMKLDFPSSVLRYEKTSAVLSTGVTVDVWPSPDRPGHSRVVLTWASPAPAPLPQDVALLEFTAVAIGTARLEPAESNPYEVVDEFGQKLQAAEPVKLRYSDRVEVKAPSPPPVLEIRIVAKES